MLAERAALAASTLALALSGSLAVDDRPALSKGLRAAGLLLPAALSIAWARGLLWFQPYLAALAGAVGVAVSLHSEGFYRALYGKASYPQTLIDLSLALMALFFSSEYFGEAMIYWLVFDVAAIMLILMERGLENLRAAVAYIAMCVLPSDVSLLSSWALEAQRLGPHGALASRLADLALSPVPLGPALGYLVLFGFASKLGLFPLHMWQSAVYPEAPSHASAALAGVAKKMGLFGLLAAQSIFAVDPPVYWLLACQAAVTVAYGFMAAALQSDVKRMLAYSSVGYAGVMGLLASLQGAAGGWMAQAAVFVALCHGVAKALGFMQAGLFEQVANARSVYELGYVAHAVPESAAPGVVAGLNFAGAPPTAGFFAKALLVYAAVACAQSGLAAGAALLAIAAAAGAFSAMYSAKLVACYFASPRPPARRAPPVDPAELASERYLAAASVALPALAAPWLGAPLPLLAVYAASLPALAALVARASRPEHKPWLSGVEA